MLRDKNCECDFERTLLQQLNKLKLATRKLHNDMMCGYDNPRADRDFTDAMLALVNLAYTDDD